MQQNTNSSAVLKSLKQSDVNPQMMLSYYEGKIKQAEADLEEYKKNVRYLQKVINGKRPLYVNEFQLKVVNIRWRPSIIQCLTLEAGFHLATSTQIANCIATIHELQIANREIKSTTSSTLSLMFKHGLVGRIGGVNGREHLYGLKDFFEPDLMKLKKEYRKEYEKYIK